MHLDTTPKLSKLALKFDAWKSTRRLFRDGNHGLNGWPHCWFPSLGAHTKSVRRLEEQKAWRICSTVGMWDLARWNASYMWKIQAPTYKTCQISCCRVDFLSDFFWNIIWPYIYIYIWRIATQTIERNSLSCGIFYWWYMDPYGSLWVLDHVINRQRTEKSPSSSTSSSSSSSSSSSFHRSL